MSTNYEFSIGEPVKIESLNIICNVEKELGSGTQGKVYSLICPDNSSFVLKWYFPSMATHGQLEILSKLVQKESPSEKNLWPLVVVNKGEKEGFGYVMFLKDSRFKSFSLWLSRKVDTSFKILLTSCFELAQSFHFLHSKGLCYQDLSINNIYFDPETGEIKIGDTDNIVINGANKGNVIGTPKFMAPEIIVGDSLLNTQTDLFSLAVILFYILFLNHPLEGKKESSIKSLDLPAMSKLYGFEPVFIFDPYDTSNSPDPAYNKNALIFWNIYPDFFKNLFIRAFTNGIHDPINGRVRETEWQFALISLRDLICYCDKCGSENFLFPDEVKCNTNNNNVGSNKNNEIISNITPLNYLYLQSFLPTCWNEKCKSLLQKQFYIKIDDKIIVLLNHDTKLYPHHVDSEKRYDFSNPIAEVTKHPYNPNIWGLKNLSNEPWTIKTTDNDYLLLDPGKNMTLNPGLTINFGSSNGIICY
jgi:serine/threonine protein kinase